MQNCESVRNLISALNLSAMLTHWFHSFSCTEAQHCSIAAILVVRISNEGK